MQASGAVHGTRTGPDISVAEDDAPCGRVYPNDEEFALKMAHNGSLLDITPVDGSRREMTSEEKRQTWQVLAVLSALMGFASISTDLYLPAMPVIGREFHVGQSEMALTISAYLAGFGSGQLFWGPLADRQGRRVPVMAGLSLFVIGSAGCALAPTAPIMIALRIVQAVGASAGVVLGRAMVRDIYPGPKGAQMLSTLMTVMAIAPLLGPTIGGQILLVGGWRLIFWALVAIGLVTLVSLKALPETLPVDRRNRAPLSHAFADYRLLLADRRLIALAGTGGFFYAGTFAYVAASPFAYIDYYGVPPQYYGLLFGAGIVGIMIMNVTNARLVIRIGSARMLRRGALGAAVAGVAVGLTAYTGWGAFSDTSCRCSSSSA